jgi:hypothetical protein
MTQLCYSLEDAAQRLDVSETVLFRLSQAFKVPASAYEAVGALSFKGDPVFAEPELAFFREVKERLLAGETLEALKRRPPSLSPPPRTPSRAERPIALSALRRASTPPTPLISTTPARAPAILKGEKSETLPLPASPLSQEKTSGARAVFSLPVDAIETQEDSENFENASAEKPSSTEPVLLSDHSDLSGNDAPDGSVLREIENPRLLHRLAEQSLKRYKTQHGVGLGQVFKKILDGIGLSPLATGQETSGSLFPPVIPVEWRSSFFPHPPAAFNRPPVMPTSAETTEIPGIIETPGDKDEDEVSSNPAPSSGFSDPLFYASSRGGGPRVLDTRLSQAARQLKESALRRATR